MTYDSMQTLTDSGLEPDDEGECWRCQHCGKVTPAKRWTQKGQACPECGGLYHWLWAQDEEED